MHVYIHTYTRIREDACQGHPWDVLGINPKGASWSVLRHAPVALRAPTATWLGQHGRAWADLKTWGLLRNAGIPTVDSKNLGQDVEDFDRELGPD